MAIIEIKNRWNGKVLYSGEHESLKEAVKEALANSEDRKSTRLNSSHT
nr:hypothetical protein [Rivihabitans pingtungensis]